MIRDQFGQQIYSEQDLFDHIMAGNQLPTRHQILVDMPIDTRSIRWLVDELPRIETYEPVEATLAEFDRQNQQQWLMPEAYRVLDVAKYILDKCTCSAELQRAGEELLIYAERDMLDLLRYLVYLVDTMRAHNLVCGVGRGSSVASFVLYLIGIHQVNSLEYDLDINEFLR